MASPSNTQSKDQIVRDFKRLLTDFKAQESKIITRDELAEKQRERKIVDAASTYTVENIVKGLADLQLYFEGVVKTNAERLASELDKLDELRKAIKIQNERLQLIQNVRLAADALDILKKDHEDQVKRFESSASETRQALDKEISETRDQWKTEQKEFDQAAAEYNDRQTKDRERNKLDYEYELERQKKVALDAYEEDKRNLDRSISEKEAAKQKDWSERTRKLDDAKADFEKNKAKVDSFDQELEAASKKAREDAIRETLKDAENRAELFQAEIAGQQKLFELKKQTLDSTIQQNADRITALQTQLQSAINQFNQSTARVIDSAKASQKG
jgi:hypothetical protein